MSASDIDPQHAAASGSGDTVDPGTARVPMLDTRDWQAVNELARTDPLAHPLAFSMGPIGFEYPTPPHLIELYGALYRAVTPDFPNAPKQLMRLMPRDHGKSEAGSVVFPTWLALNNPNIRILIMMHKEGKASGKLQQCATHIKRLAPHFDRVVERSNSTELRLERSENYDVPTIEAAGFESGVTGGHYDCIIFDDIVRWETQNTETQRRKALSKFENAINLGDEGETTYLVLGTRKHRDDLYSSLLKRDAWDTSVRRAISDFSIVENNEFTLVTNTGAEYPAEKYGRLPPDETLVRVKPHHNVPVCWPDRYSLGDLIFEYLSAGGTSIGRNDGEDAEERLESDTLGSGVEWIREKQNEPEALEGVILSEDIVTFHDHLPHGVHPRDLITFVGIDLGIEEDPQKAMSSDADYWAIAIVGWHPETETAYIRDIVRKRGQSVEQAVQWTKRELQPYDYGTVHVESIQAQDFFRQALSRAGVTTTKVNPSRQKEQRIISMSSWLENGTARVVGDPDSAKWQSFLSEWVGFPTHSHDDRLDALSISLHALGEYASSPKSQFHI